MESTSPQMPGPPSQAARNLAILAHLGPIALSLLSAGVLGWLVPLIVYLTQKNELPFAARHALESLNFRITLLLVYLVSLPFLILFWCIGIPLWIAVWLAEIVLAIVAAVRASDGLEYRYPLALRLIG
jgi:hypothetical protein